MQLFIRSANHECWALFWSLGDDKVPLHLWELTLYETEMSNGWNKKKLQGILGDKCYTDRQ